MLCLDLFTGLGGMGRLLPVAPVMFCENAEFPRRVLERRIASGDLPPVPIHGDVKTLDPPDHDILIGGFPCTDICKLGLKKGLDGDESSLYYQILRIVREKHPKYVFLENVTHIMSMPEVWKVVVRSLSLAGYDMKWCVFGASSVGAVHRRNRWFLLARYTGVECDVTGLPEQHMGKFGRVKDGVYIKVRDPGAPRNRMKKAFYLKALVGVKTRGKVCNRIFKRTLWATPRARGGCRAVRNMSLRSICDLPSQLRFASTTPDSDRHMAGNLKWVENLMGLPAGWTDPECDYVEDFPGFGVEVYKRMKPAKLQKNYYKRWQLLGNMCVSQTALYAYTYLMQGKLLKEGYF